MQLYIGCSEWSYDAWLGHFYSVNLGPREFLKYYSQVFDLVEIDSSFYRPPNLFMRDVLPVEIRGNIAVGMALSSRYRIDFSPPSLYIR